jgi:hypothetical protein
MSGLRRGGFASTTMRLAARISQRGCGQSEKMRVISKALMLLRKMARETGLEPATSGVTGRRSNQLSYSRVIG